jgi:hypothetical protein
MEILSEWIPSHDMCSYCHTHQRSCANFPPRSTYASMPGRYHLETAGICCQPWSARGCQRGWADERSLPCLVLVRVLQVVRPNGVCLECTPRFDFATLQKLMGPEFTSDKCVTIPAMQGAPLARRRMYMWFDLVSSLQAIHYPLDLHPTLSRRSLVLDASIYAQATDAQVQATHQWFDEQRLRRNMKKTAPASMPRRLRRNMKKTAPASMPSAPRDRRLCSVPSSFPRVSRSVLLEELLSGSERCRFLDHMGQVEKLPASERARGMFVDISQNLKFGTKPCGSHIPTLTRHTRLVYVPPRSGRRGARMATPEELLAMHGLELSRESSQNLSPHQVQLLVGNSMHVAQVGRFLQHCLASRSFNLT